MAEPALADAIEIFEDRRWRLNNLYYIEDKKGNTVQFQMNAAQERLLDELHDLNIILKARQLGFSTFILLLALDCCVFNSQFHAGLVADTKDNASKLLKRIKYAYERMPKEIRGVVQVVTDNAFEVEFSNGSSVEVGVSLRSGTKNFLHVSEYGKICAKHPDRAKEVKSGSLNTMAHGQLGFIESTAEGRSGDFYDKTEQARKIADSGREPVEMEWKFHFFPWFMDPSYTTDSPVTFTAEENEYFKTLREEHAIFLTNGQMRWYTLKAREQGDDMLKEFPSTPDEAFQAAKDGAYFGKEMRLLRQRGLVSTFEIDPRSPINTFWDLGAGANDYMSIWMHQLINGQHRFVGFDEGSGEGLQYYFDRLEKWRVRHGCIWGKHHGPHDMEHPKIGITAASPKETAQQLGWEFEVIPRTPEKRSSIHNARMILPTCCFHEGECAAGITHIENYSRAWDDVNGVWKQKPRHDEHSHGTDAFFTFADSGFTPQTNKSRRQPDNSGRVY